MCLFVFFCFVKLYSLWYFSNQNQLDGSNNTCFINISHAGLGTDLLLHLVVQRNKPTAQCITSHIKS